MCLHQVGPGGMKRAQALPAARGGPEHAYLAAAGRATYVPAGDDEVLEALQTLARTEGIIPALEPAHALAWVTRAAAGGELPSGCTVLVTLSGRGDKDAEQVMGLLR